MNTGIGDVFEREKRINGRTVRVADLVFVFAQLGPGLFSWPEREQFMRPNLTQEYQA